MFTARAHSREVSNILIMNANDDGEILGIKRICDSHFTKNLNVPLHEGPEFTIPRHEFRFTIPR